MSLNLLYVSSPNGEPTEIQVLTDFKSSEVAFFDTHSMIEVLVKRMFTFIGNKQLSNTDVSSINIHCIDGLISKVFLHSYLDSQSI